MRDLLSRTVVGVTGFEPATSCSQSRRATKLRYTPLVLRIRYTTAMERTSMIVLAPMLVVFVTILDIVDGTAQLAAPSHPAWSIAVFFAVSLVVLFLALETCPRNPVTRMNSSLGVYFGYIVFGSFFASLTRTILRAHLDVDTVAEMIPVTVLATSALIVSVSMLARVLRPQKND